MKTLIATTLAVFFLLTGSVFAQFEKEWRDIKDGIRIGEDILNTGNELKKKYIGESAEISFSNGFPEASSILLEVAVNSNRKGDTVLTLSTGQSGVATVQVFSDEGTNVNSTIKAFRLVNGEKEFLFSYQKEFFMNMNFRSTSHTVNESASRTYMGNGKTSVVFVNHKKNVVSIMFFNNGSQRTEVLDPNERVSVVFNNDATPLASILIEEWIQDEGGEVKVLNSEKQQIVFSDYFFAPFIIK